MLPQVLLVLTPAVMVLTNGCNDAAGLGDATFPLLIVELVLAL